MGRRDIDTSMPHGTPASSLCAHHVPYAHIMMQALARRGCPWRWAKTCCPHCAAGQHSSRFHRPYLCLLSDPPPTARWDNRAADREMLLIRSWSSFGWRRLLLFHRSSSVYRAACLRNRLDCHLFISPAILDRDSYRCIVLHQPSASFCT